jgi:hypothetical protein
MIMKYFEQSTKFLTLINAGAIVATMSFMGAEPKIRTMAFVWSALTCFLVGLILVGAQFVAQLVTGFDVVRRFTVNTRRLADGVNARQAFKTPRWYPLIAIIPISLGLGSYGCFIGGSWQAVHGLRDSLIPRAVAANAAAPAAQPPPIPAAAPPKQTAPAR